MVFNKIGGYDEEYIECFEDVAYNLDCIEDNRKNIFLGEAVAYHYESQTRGKTEEQRKREANDWNNRLLLKITKNNKFLGYINKF